MGASAIQVKGLSKRFGKIQANDNISLDIKKGEILCLLGENGFGKITLMNMLSGIYQPDSGEIFADGKKNTRSRTIRNTPSIFALVRQL